MRFNFKNVGEGIGALGDAYNKVQLGRAYDEASKQTMRPAGEGSPEEQARAAEEAAKIQREDFKTFSNIPDTVRYGLSPEQEAMARADQERGNLGANYQMPASTSSAVDRYGLGTKPTEFRNTPYTPSERRTVGLEAQADFLARQGRTEEASRLLDTVEARKTGALNQQLLQENVGNAGLRRQALTQGLTKGGLDISAGEQGLAKGAREASQAVAAEKVAVLSAELEALDPKSSRYAMLQRKIASQTAGLSLTDRAHIASLAKTHMDLEVATANRDWMKAAVTAEDAVAHYNKMYKDNYVVKIEPAAGGKNSLVKYAIGSDGEATGKPISTLLTYSDWAKEGRPAVVGNAPALAAEQWKLGTAHRYKMDEIKETGKQHISYAKALSTNKEIKMTDAQKIDLDSASQAIDDATSADIPDQKKINAAIVKFNGMVRRIGIDNKVIGMIPSTPSASGPQAPSMTLAEQRSLEDEATTELQNNPGWPTGKSEQDKAARRKLVKDWIDENYGDLKVRGLGTPQPPAETPQVGGAVADNPALRAAQQRARLGPPGPAVR